MPVFAYTGMDSAGRPAKGVRDADSPKALRALLRREGIFLTDVREDRAGTGRPAAAGKGLKTQFSLSGLFPDKITRAEISTLTRQLATLLKAGITLSESLAALFDQVEKPGLKRVVGEIRTRVNEGSPLADAMAAQTQRVYPIWVQASVYTPALITALLRHSLAKDVRVFPDLYTGMVRAGETAGNLDVVLARLADFMEAELKLKSKVSAAMVYPIIMAIVGVAIVGILMVAVIPKITTIFEDNEQSLHWNTELLIWSSHVIGKWWWLIVIGWVLIGLAFGAWKRSKKGKITWHRIVLKLPLVGPLVRMIAVARFARTLGTMLASGVPLLKALDVAKDILGNVVLVDAVEKAKEAIKEGESIAVTLRKSGHFPAIVTHMIAVGEKSGQLETMLETIAVTYEDEVDMKLTRLTSMLEPLMLVVMGGAIAFVVFSILMPIMDMQSIAQQ